MDRTAVIAALKDHRVELKKLGVLRLSLFGSTARGEATKRSDVDLAVRMKRGPRGFARLERLDAIRQRLAEILGVRVDLIEEPSDRPRIQQAIDRDRVLAF
jgi:predicted nucleotidyltransferase